MSAILFFVFLFVLYFAPSIVGEVRKHRQRHAITTLNLFLGWTLIGWVGALVWATTATEPSKSS